MHPTRLGWGLVCPAALATLVLLAADARTGGAQAPGEIGVLTGAWVLNREVSDDPSEAMDDRSAGRRRGGPGGGGMRIGGGMGGGTAIRGGAGADPERMREMRHLMERLMEAPEALTITQDAHTVTFVERDGRTRTFVTNGKKEKHPFENRMVETRTRWKERRLVKEISVGDGLKAIETYAVDADTGRLLVVVRIESRMGPPLLLRRAYDAVADVTEPGA